MGNLTPTCDFNYIIDTCNWFITIEENDSTIGKEINIASNSEISMRNTLNLIKDIMQSDVIFITDEQLIRPLNSVVFRLWGDNALIRKLTGFEPQFDLRQGLERTCEWFTKSGNLSKYKANIYNV